MSGWSPEQLAAHYAALKTLGVTASMVPDRPPGAPKRSKYGARKKEVDGHVFDSSREAARYIELKALQISGIIWNLTLQPSYVLQDAFTDADGKRHRQIRYIADFTYLWRNDDKTCQQITEDVKGFATPVWRLKDKLFRAKYPHVRLEIVK